MQVKKMTTDDGKTAARAKRLSAPVLLLLLAAILFSALGVWQIRRLAWKQDLIARVEQRIHAAPVALPTDDIARSVAIKDHEYQRVQVQGNYIASGTALVRAVTILGAGYWVLTPLKLADGRLVYVNRGYVPTGSKVETERARTPQGPQHIIGLLRLPEPGGGFLRSNDPAGDNWYSRDIALLAQARSLDHVAPFFVDAQQERGNQPEDIATPRPPSPGGEVVPQQGKGPVPGLTVVNFPNSHLSYALTWFAMAILSIGLALWLWRRRDDM